MSFIQSRARSLFVILADIFLLIPASASGTHENSQSVYRIEFNGSLNYAGSEPHLTAWILTDAGLRYLIAMDQQATLRKQLSTGYYHWKGVVKPESVSVRGLVPVHDAIIHIEEFQALP